jgi:isopentenyl-diphosphate delta-isomerase
MGFDCKLKKKFSFIYCSELKNGLIENEYDTVFMGVFNGTPKLNTKEAMDFKWINWNFLKKDIKQSPHNYSVWLKIALEKFGD